jgi:hypothetical protein
VIGAVATMDWPSVDPAESVWVWVCEVPPPPADLMATDDAIHTWVPDSAGDSVNARVPVAPDADRASVASVYESQDSMSSRSVIPPGAVNDEAVSDAGHTPAAHTSSESVPVVVTLGAVGWLTVA